MSLPERLFVYVIPLRWSRRAVVLGSVEGEVVNLSAEVAGRLDLPFDDRRNAVAFRGCGYGLASEIEEKTGVKTTYV
jgi:hypothetical protein